MLSMRSWACVAALMAALISASGCRTGSGQSATQDAMLTGHMAGMGIHGMYLFGTDQLYLSHLPLFSAPHDYQVILAVTLGSDARAAYLADQQLGSASIYTFNPVDQRFALAELTQATNPRKTFKGSIFHDHFEDGHQIAPRGTSIFDHAQVTVDRVVYFKKFDLSASPLTSLQYLIFGHGRDVWAAHIISLPPDFDQFLAVTLDGGALTDSQLGAGVSVSIPGRTNGVDTRLQDAEQVSAQADQATLNLKVTAAPYLETNDLSQ